MFDGIKEKLTWSWQRHGPPAMEMSCCATSRWCERGAQYVRCLWFRKDCQVESDAADWSSEELYL